MENYSKKSRIVSFISFLFSLQDLDPKTLHGCTLENSSQMKRSLHVVGGGEGLSKLFVDPHVVRIACV